MGNLVTQGLGVGAGGGGTAPVGPPPLDVYNWTVTTPPDFTLTATVNYVDVVFLLAISDLSLQASSPEFWLFSGPSALVCSSVEKINANTVRVYHNEALNGQTYTLTLPLSGLFDAFGQIYQGAGSATFTGVGYTPQVISTLSLNLESVRVVFSRSMNEWDCLTPSNYSISPDLAVLSVEKVSNSAFTLKTDPQTPGLSYSVTVSNVHDSFGNLI